MCMGGGDGGAGQLRAEEEARQQRIKDGMWSIDRIFYGGPEFKRGVNRASDGSTGDSFYTKWGEQYAVPPLVTDPNTAWAGLPGGMQVNNPDPGTPGYAMQHPGGALDFANAARGAMLRSSELYTGYETIPASKGFDTDFYNQRRKQYLDYALPQLEQQYGDQQDGLVYALARSGLLKSSVAAERTSRLEEQARLRRGEVAGQAVDLERQTRAEVEQARGDMISSLMASADPANAIRSSQEAVARLNMTPSFSPLGDLFSNITAGLVNQRDGQAAAEVNKSGATLFGRGRRSSSVVS